MSDLVPVTRPNGKIYTPRKPPRAFEVHRDDPRGSESFIYVLGTHDIRRARAVAGIVHDVDASSVELAWIRQTMRDGDPWFEYDDERGAPTVIFEVWE